MCTITTVLVLLILMPLLALPLDSTPSSCRPYKQTTDVECQSNNNPFEYTPWFNTWAYSTPTRRSIMHNVMAGKLIQIKQALHPLIAEHIHRELLLYQHWIDETSDNPNTLQFKRSTARHQIPALLHHFHAYLQGQDNLHFFSQFPQTDLKQWSCNGDSGGPFATEYKDHDFLSPHTDFQENRALTFILSMTQAWEKKHGGSLWWFNGRTRQFVPEFNSLFLFVPSPRTFHQVSAVALKSGSDTCSGTTCSTNATLSRRFAISGWFESVDRLQASHMQNQFPLEESRLFVVNGRGGDAET